MQEDDGSSTAAKQDEQDDNETEKDKDQIIITMIIIIMMTHLPSIQPDLVAAPQQPRQVKRARKAVTTMLKKKFWLEVTHHHP